MQESMQKVGKQHLIIQEGPGTELEPETGTVGTFFPETERGTGTVGTFFQEPQPEPALSVKTVTEQTLSGRRGTAGSRGRPDNSALPRGPND